MICYPHIQVQVNRQMRNEGRACLMKRFRYDRVVPQNTEKQTGAAEHRTKRCRTDAAEQRDAFALTIVTALAGDRIFGPLRIQRHEKVNCLLRRLHHLSHVDPEMSGKQIQLLHNDRILDPSMSVLQSTDPLPSIGEHELVLTMIAKPLLLTWEQLVAMPCLPILCVENGLPKEEHRACTRQRRLRSLCFENNMREVDLSDAGYEWRLLLKTMPSAITKDVIGVGVTRFTFRLLDNIDENYAGYRGYTGERHVFEISCADGDRWHLHFHQTGSCDVEHLPFNDLEA
jgi:hypothetical protein